MRRRRPESAGHEQAPSDLLRHRCRMLVRRGRHREAVAALRELVQRDHEPAAWVRLGVVLARCERGEAAIDALKQGWWLHRRAGHPRRAEVVTGLIEQVRGGAFSPAAA